MGPDSENAAGRARSACDLLDEGREDHPGVPCEAVDVLVTAGGGGLAIVIGVHVPLQCARAPMAVDRSSCTDDSPAGSSPQLSLEDLVMAPWPVRERVLTEPLDSAGHLEVAEEVGPLPEVEMPHDGCAVVPIELACLEALESDLIRLKPVVIRLAWKRRCSTAELLRLPGPCFLVAVVRNIPTGFDCAGPPWHLCRSGT